MAEDKGILFVISAPSGCGKTTLCNKLLKAVPGMVRSISITTRPPRKDEENGRDYFFVSEKEFIRRRRNKNLLEWAKNFGYYYGTPKDKVLNFLDGGRDVILAIDVKGAMKIKKLFPDAVFIFIKPPSVAELEKRLKKRKTDDRLEISRRMKVVRRELSYTPRYKYSIVNDNLKKALGRLISIVMAEKHATHNAQRKTHQRVNA